MTTLTLMTYNLHSGIPMGHEFGRYTVTEKEVRDLAATIQSAKPDVVATQETDCEYAGFLAPERRRSSSLNEPRLLASLTGLRYVFGSTQDDTHYPSDNGGYVEWGSAEQWTNNGAAHGEVGNALLLRYPFQLSPLNIPLPIRRGKERRASVRAELLRENGTSFDPPLVVYSTHLQHDSGADRKTQLEFLLRRVSKEPEGATVFVLGDLNHAALDQPGQKLPEGDSDLQAFWKGKGFHDLADEFARARGGIPEPTYPADHPKERIDYILCNRALEILDTRVIDSQASDHRPVVVTVRID